MAAPRTQMYLGPTQDEQDVLTSTRRHLAAAGGAERLRALEHEPAVTDRSWWSTGAELGWVAPLVPEEWGGGCVTGTPLRELGLVAHEQGRVAAATPLIGVNAALAALTLAVRDGWDPGDLLERVVAGEQVVVATGGAGRPWAVHGTELTIVRDEGGLVVSGDIAQVDVTGAPELLLVSARADGQPVQLLLPVDAPGVERTPLVGLDLGRRHARLRLDDVRLTSEHLVAEGPAAARQGERQFLVASALLAADSCGALTTGFESTMEWVTHRFTFGRPLASYQALKHRIADIRTHLECAFAVTLGALEALDANSDDAAELVSVAAAYVGEHAPFVFSEFIQLHGGIGVTWEHDLHVHLRRVVANAAVHGAPADHQRRLAAIVLKGDPA